MPKTRFLSTYRSELAWRIDEDVVDRARPRGDGFPLRGKAELVVAVTSSNPTVPSKAVSSRLNPLERCVRRPSTRPCNPPKAQKAARL
jgi:hypothetical protein